MMKKKFRKTAVFLLTATITAGSVVACGSSSKNAAAETTAAYSSFDMTAPMANSGSGMIEDGYYEEAEMKSYAVAETAAAAAAAPAPAYAPITEDTITENGAPYGTSQETPSTPVDAPSSPADNTSTGQAAIQRKLIRTVSLDVETTDFDTLLPSIRQSVAAEGGYIEQSDVSGTSISTAVDRKRYAFLTVRIPSAKLDSFLAQMSDQSNVINRSENVMDITLQYTDIESRKKSLTIEQERLWALLEKADTLEAVIALEERLSEIRYQLEGFESQLRTYDNQVDYSTVHISIQEVGVFTPTAPDSVGTRIQKGFVRNLENVSNSLTDLLVWVISHLPALVLLAVVAAGIRTIVKKLLRRKAPDAKEKNRKDWTETKNQSSAGDSTKEKDSGSDSSL